MLWQMTHNFWLRGALRKVNEQYFHLGMTPDDFAVELPDEWAPIQINPDEPAIQEAARQPKSPDRGFGIS